MKDRYQDPDPLSLLLLVEDLQAEARGAEAHPVIVLL